MLSHCPMEDEAEVHPKRMKSNPPPSTPSENISQGVNVSQSSSAAADKMMTVIPGQITIPRQQVMSPSGVNLQDATLLHPGQPDMPGTNPPEGVSPRTMVQVVESQFVVVLRGQEQFRLNCEQHWLQGREAMQEMVVHHHAEAAELQRVQRALQHSELNAQEEAQHFKLWNQVQQSEIVAQQQVNNQLKIHFENLVVEARAHAAQQLLSLKNCEEQCSQRIMKECRKSSILEEVLETERTKAAQWQHEVQVLQHRCEEQEKQEGEAWKQECRTLKAELQKKEVALKSMTSSLQSRKTISLMTSEEYQQWQKKYEEAQSTCFQLFDTATKSSEEVTSAKAECAIKEECEQMLKLQLQQALDQVKVQDTLKLDAKLNVR